MLNQIVKFFLENKTVTVLTLLLVTAWGISTAPFDWEIGWLPRDPVPVDAIPDIGENQQIVFTEWMGRSPQDVEDQITYPLTTALLGMPHVKDIRSTSMFGFSSIYIIFDDEVDYYWSRTRILEKLNSLPNSLLPEGVSPQLGPDATALGQVFWYTLEGRDEQGNPTGGWDLHELRTAQDFFVRYGLASVEGVAEVASVGGHIKEYQVDLNPTAMKAYNVSMMDVMGALQGANQDVGANTLEINQVEYYVRGLGYVKNLADIEEAVVKVNENVPVRIKDIAFVTIGPADRSMLGILDKGGAEAVGGVVVARYGDNPLAVIKKVKEKIKEIAPGLPAKQLADGRTSRVTIVPFYDRTELIYETLGTLNEAIVQQILITVIVILVMIFNLRASILISALLPMGVLMCFIFMRYFGVDANIVALSGIAIAIGTMVDLGIILSDNIIQRLNSAPPGQTTLQTVYEATTEVAGAIVTAASTTVVSFLPVFTLEAAEGKLFGPLAFTKSFALIASLIFTLVFMPAFAHWFFGMRVQRQKWQVALNAALAVGGIAVIWLGFTWAGFSLIALAINNLYWIWRKNQPESTSTLSGWRKRFALIKQEYVTVFIAVLSVSWLLATDWMPLGVDVGEWANFLFVLLVVALLLGGFEVFIFFYPHILRWCLANKGSFLTIPMLIMLMGGSIWLGFDRIFGFLPNMANQMGWNLRATSGWSYLAHAFPGMGKEFMPALDEGAFLLMPTSMPHSGVEANKQIVQNLDRLVSTIPEIELVVGKAGRAETALDPAPMSMYENLILYKSEYITDPNGQRIRFRTNEDGSFARDEKGNLIPDENGQYYRQWRDHIRTSSDIWTEIVQAANLPGVTSAPKLQPIETRLVMLQTGMRAPMGIKVYGPDLATIEQFSLQLERFLKEVPSVKAEAVFADRSLGKPYLEIELDRRKIARYGLTIKAVQEYIEVTLGGMALTTTVEGRERYSIRARYAREWRDDPQSVGQVLIATPTGAQIPLAEIAEVQYRPGPMMIRGENAFLTGYVLLDKQPEQAEVTVVEDAQRYLNNKIESGELVVPAGVSFKFSGSYENQVRAEKRLAFVIPLCLALIFLIIYLQFRSVAITLFIFVGVGMAFSGGFMMIWLYGKDWFLNFDLLGINLHELFQMRAYNLSVAVWVGFIALFGIATDDGVVMSEYLEQSFEKLTPNSIAEVRSAVLEAGLRRLRPCLMTSGGTLLALLPVFTSTGRGSDIMIPMAIPSFGGMTVALITLFIVPVLYSWRKEISLKKSLPTT